MADTTEQRIIDQPAATAGQTMEMTPQKPSNQEEQQKPKITLGLRGGERGFLAGCLGALCLCCACEGCLDCIDDCCC